MNIPLVDLKRQYATIEGEITEAIGRVTGSCGFVLGAEVEAFEKAFAEYLEVDHVIGVGSGTDALQLALLEAGVGPGDEVIIPANTFIATALAVTYTGARPVLVDIEDEGFNMDLDLIEDVITDKTKAIVPVHLYGQSADMDDLIGIAGGMGIKLIEDACQAHGAHYQNKRVGTLARSGCFSFYPGKNLGAYGDGGAIVTRDAEVADRLRLLRNYGQREKYKHESIGWNSRLDGMQAAVLGVKLPRLDDWNQKRRAAASLYRELLAGTPVKTPVVLRGRDHVFHIYSVRVLERDRVLRELNEAGIGAGMHYPIPIHLQECYSDLGYKEGDFPVTELIASQQLSLPIFPEIEEDEVRAISAKLIEVVGDPLKE